MPMTKGNFQTVYFMRVDSVSHTRMVGSKVEAKKKIRLIPN
jgi:hypothetical protein